MMKHPFVTSVERCIAHNERPSVAEVRFEVTTTAGSAARSAVVQYYAPVCEDCMKISPDLLETLVREIVIRRMKRTFGVHTAFGRSN